jgi:hypothetical protein
MDKQVLQQIKPLLNNPQLLTHLNDYFDSQIVGQHKIMEQSNDIIVIHRAQGAVAILKRLKLLRDEVNGIK